MHLLKTVTTFGAVALLLLSAPGARAEKTIWLSALDLSKATQGYGQPQTDKSVDGHPLTLNGQVYAHGFGTHSPGVLALALAGGTRSFTATVGVDDEVGGGKGNVEFEVLGDGQKMLWRSGVMHQGQPSKSLDVDLTGVQSLVLRVTTGDAGYEFCHADWADAKFDVVGAQPQTVVFAPAVIEPVISMTSPPDAPQIHPPFRVGFHPGTSLLWTVPVSGERPLAFSSQGLPKGLTLDAATGTVTGTTPAAGDYAVHMRVRNRDGSDARTVHLVAGPTLALTPPMGWNSYDAYGDSVTEAEVMANARYVQHYLQPYGWDTVTVDYRWYDPGAHDNNANGRAGAALAMDAYGRLLPAPNRFPSAADGRGFTALAAKIHAMGLKFGIHIMRGIPRSAVSANLPIEDSPFHAADAANTEDICPWCPDMYGVRGDTPPGRAYYDSLFRLYASWGLDFVKMDDTSKPYHTDEINAVHDALARCGRSLVYSLSPGETPVEQAGHVETHANLWRVSDDFWDNWGTLNYAFSLDMRWHGVGGPGHWPDSDMLPLGHLSVGGRSVRGDRRTNFTHAEQLTLISLWALQPAPLIVGAALPDNDAWTRSLLTNPEVLAVDQDALGLPGARVWSSGDALEVWAKKLADGSLAVGLFNRGDFADDVPITWADLGITGRRTVRDLWQRKTRGVYQNQFSAPVPPHGAVLLRLIP